MDLKQLEAEGLLFVANSLQANEAAIEAALGPVEVVAIADGIKLADEAFAKLPLGIGALVDAAFAQYAKQFTPAELNGFVGQGLNFVVSYLKAAADKVAA
jgi:hypothetical protein